MSFKSVEVNSDIFYIASSYLLIPWSRVLLEKLTGSQLVKKFPALFGTRKFITALTSFLFQALNLLKIYSQINFVLKKEGLVEGGKTACSHRLIGIEGDVHMCIFQMHSFCVCTPDLFLFTANKNHLLESDYHAIFCFVSLHTSH